jgi:hypothetical protein
MEVSQLSTPLLLVQGEFVGRAIGEVLKQLFFDVLMFFLVFIAPVILIIWIVSND